MEVAEAAEAALGDLEAFGTVTGIGRPLDLGLRSNRVAVAGFVLGTVIGAGVGWYRADRSIVGALITGLAVFVAWATARELTPDYPSAATVAAVLALAAALVAPPSILVSGVALIGLRLVAGTVGAAVSRFDVGVLVVLGVVAGVIPVLWITAIAIGAWVWAAPEVGHRRRVAGILFVVGVASGLALAYVLGREYGWAEIEITTTAYVLTAFAGGVMLLAARPTRVISQVDAGTARIDVARIRLARLAAGSFVMWATVMGGVAGFVAIAPATAALVATAVFRVFREPA